MDPPLAQSDMEVIREAVMLRDPPEPLVLTTERKHEKNEHLDYLVNEVVKWNREQGPKWCYVPFYVRPHQINAGLTRDMVNDFQRLSQVCKVSYRLENITDEIWGYEVRVYVLPTK